MEIEQRTFLVTGGSSGLGAACARRIVAAGGQVTIADLNEQAGRALADELGEAAIFAPTDVTSETSVQQAIEQTLARFTRLSGLINCAGVALAMKVLGKEGPHVLAAFERVLRINVLGTFNCIRLAAMAMSQNSPDGEGERGVIINTASCAAFEGQIGQAAYSASKAAVAGMTLPVARELARIGIRVMTIAPGTFDTPMLAGLPQAARDSLAEQVPFPSRLGRPEEFAALAEHIIENLMLNGEVIRLDGALRMGPR
jgi:NAD(P)-dependent dehydrogenase (short-subunit alcohol dehydrogenase family)